MRNLNGGQGREFVENSVAGGIDDKRGSRRVIHGERKNKAQDSKEKEEKYLKRSKAVKSKSKDSVQRN